ncbi:carboxymuconolactone decarboxylase family protein [Emcibacter sp.]|uniref:carboxymuconolactone decarboxylase family protein n=1 Tax=Emcibacter sp. TaxID=1979954 RepID=UPI002AA6C7E5|nr:carboxymuconolactone decarboxylase family protein [Emcibacter sp.]
MMSKDELRISPLKRSEWTEGARDVFAVLGGPEERENGPRYKIISVLAKHPQLMRPFLEYNRQLLMNSVLPGRERELIILYVGWTCRSAYEWLSHVREGLRSGVITEEDISALKQGSDSSHWADFERTLLRAVDQLRETHTLDDDLWTAISEKFDETQMLEFLFAVGNYILMSGVVNALRMPLEEGAEGAELVIKYGVPS